MTTATWFLSRKNSNGEVDLSTYNTDGKSDREQEAISNLRNTLEMGARAAKALA